MHIHFENFLKKLLIFYFEVFYLFCELPSTKYPISHRKIARRQSTVCQPQFQSSVFSIQSQFPVPSKKYQKNKRNFHPPSAIHVTELRSPMARTIHRSIPYHYYYPSTRNSLRPTHSNCGVLFVQY